MILTFLGLPIENKSLRKKSTHSIEHHNCQLFFGNTFQRIRTSDKSTSPIFLTFLSTVEGMLKKRQGIIRIIKISSEDCLVPFAWFGQFFKKVSLFRLLGKKNS